MQSIGCWNVSSTSCAYQCLLCAKYFYLINYFMSVPCSQWCVGAWTSSLTPDVNHRRGSVRIWNHDRHRPGCVMCSLFVLCELRTHCFAVVWTNVCIGGCQAGPVGVTAHENVLQKTRTARYAKSFIFLRKNRTLLKSILFTVFHVIIYF